ncbi:MAG: hypothetical protein ABW185_27970 [Sedimenticola sp.]
MDRAVGDVVPSGAEVRREESGNESAEIDRSGSQGASVGVLEVGVDLGGEETPGDGMGLINDMEMDDQTHLQPLSTECIFPKCNVDNKGLVSVGPRRIRSIIAASKTRGDTIHLSLASELDRDPDLSVMCHRDCVGTYTSKHHISRALKKRKPTDERSHSAPPVRKRRSDIQPFEFKKHCLFCGNLCLPRDKKNPSRWREVCQCSTDEPGEESMKYKILKACDDRSDTQASDVRIRVQGAPYDLVAAEAQYHKDCFQLFTSERNMHAAQSKACPKPVDMGVNAQFESLVEIVNDDPSHIWTSVELHNRYNDLISQESGPVKKLSRRELISELQTHFGDTIVKLDISGCASLVCFKAHLPDNLRLEKVDDTDLMIDNMTDVITTECRALPKTRDYDISQFRKAKTIENTSPTLLSLISVLVSNGQVTKASITIAQSIQAHITKTYNQTTLGLAVKLHHRFGSRELVSLLHESGITASYHEVLRFRTSAAIYTGSKPYALRGLKPNGGELSSWIDNYDLNVFTPNGCRETHALVVEVTQQPTDDDDDSGDWDTSHQVIPRISKTEIGTTKLSELSPIVIQHYEGPKNPLPPVTDVHSGVPYHVVVQRMGDLKKSLNADLEWLSQIVTPGDDEPPTEWSGYMNHLAREDGFVSKATRYLYGPLIDSTPSHPDTVLTSLLYIEEFMKSHGQLYVHLVADLQLFKVAMQIKWSNPTRWKYLLVRPGGMHTLMSFIGCIGTLMKGTGLEEILCSAYKGVNSMLNGKAWPKALRGFRMVVTGLLKKSILSGKRTIEDMDEMLSTPSSKTHRLWVDCFIIPVILAHLFIRAERESKYALHMYCLTRMLPYFFAAGHWNYARYLTHHINEFLTQVDEEALTTFYNGQHVCRHKDGSWNGVFSDQFGEQTYIRYGKAKGGLVGMTLSPDQVAGWVLSNHTCNAVSQAMDDMFQDREDDEYDTKTNKHKEEGKQRKIQDGTDRMKIHQELEKYPHPLEQDENEPLFNIVNGHVADGKVNVENALVIGEVMAADFNGRPPTGFYNAIHAKVVTMETMKRGVKVGDKTVYDMEKLYARLLILSQRRDVSLDKLLCFELAPLPPALFDDYGSMRKSSKSQLLHRLAVWSEDTSVPDAEVVDGNEMLYHITWPKIGTVRSLLQSFSRVVEKDHTVIVVFDRYVEGSIKTHERLRRTGTTVCRDLNLTIETSLPTRDSIMKSSHNKRELIKVFCAEHESQNVTMVGEEGVSQHEEADCIIISHVLHLIEEGHERIQIVSDDTDIFALLVFFCWKWKSTSQISMKKGDGRVIDINATAEKLGAKSSQLLALHALSGCDTVSYLFGKGKTSAVTLMLKNEVGLELLGEEDTSSENLLTIGHRFVGLLYKAKAPPASMNDLRHSIFVSKRSTPKIKSLPPTDAALDEHIKRAHLQTQIWKASDKLSPPDVNIADFGWEVINHTPTPRSGVSDVAPPQLMKVVACGCSTQTACSRQTCSCHGAALSCTSFCKCITLGSCNNPHTMHDEIDSDDESEDDRHE